MIGKIRQGKRGTEKFTREEGIFGPSRKEGKKGMRLSV